MSDGFSVEPATPERIQELAAGLPANPFFSPGYAAAQQAAGFESLLFVGAGSGRPTAAAIGLLKAGRFTKALTIETGPALEPDNPFWDGVRRFCRQAGARRLILGTIGSGGSVPNWPGEVFRSTSEEFIIPLQGPPVRFSKSHRQRVAAAVRLGLVIERTRSVDALEDYRTLIAASNERRRLRGEKPGRAWLPIRTVASILEQGAGEIWFAATGNDRIASMLLVSTDRAAYYAGAGADSRGLEASGAYFLIEGAVRQCQAAGLESFNLGGVPPQATGLRWFKAGFSSQPVRCEYAQFLMGGPVERGLLRAANWAAAYAQRRSGAS